MFGICRGIQEMNVALGGSLHYRLHLLEDKDDHRMPRHDDVTVEEIFKLRHAVQLARGGLFERLVGASEVMVNSLHGQGIDELAGALEVEAVTPRRRHRGCAAPERPHLHRRRPVARGVEARGARALAQAVRGVRTRGARASPIPA